MNAFVCWRACTSPCIWDSILVYFKARVCLCEFFRLCMSVRARAGLQSSDYWAWWKIEARHVVSVTVVSRHKGDSFILLHLLILLLPLEPPQGCPVFPKISREARLLGKPSSSESFCKAAFFPVWCCKRKMRVYTRALWLKWVSIDLVHASV